MLDLLHRGFGLRPNFTSRRFASFTPARVRPLNQAVFELSAGPHQLGNLKPCPRSRARVSAIALFMVGGFIYWLSYRTKGLDTTTLKAVSSRLRVAPRVEALRAHQQYQQALECIATLRPAIDDFFDQVVVMAPEGHLRRNRLALIAAVLSDFSSIADFSEVIVLTER